jgi:hypothetical protein
MKSVAAQELARIIEEAARDATAESDIELPELDVKGDALSIARQLLDHASKTMAALRSDSPRLNPARVEARSLVKLIEHMEREKAAVETPEEAERRLRREDGETWKRIIRYVTAYEARARADGTCVHCGSPLTAEKLIELYGDDGEGDDA